MQIEFTGTILFLKDGRCIVECNEVTAQPKFGKIAIIILLPQHKPKSDGSLI